MDFKPMDADEIWKALEGHEDVLTGMDAKERLHLKTFSCPRCRGSSLETFTDPHRPFTQASPLPHKLLRCLACSTEFDPQSGIITRITDE